MWCHDTICIFFTVEKWLDVEKWHIVMESSHHWAAAWCVYIYLYISMSISRLIDIIMCILSWLHSDNNNRDLCCVTSHPPSPTCNMLSLPGRSSSPLWSWSKLTPWWLLSLIQPQNNRTASQAPSFKERVREKTKILISESNPTQQQTKKKLVTEGDATPSLHLPLIAPTSAARLCCRDTPRGWQRLQSPREAPAGGAKARSAMTEAGVEQPLENCAPGKPAQAKNYRQDRRRVGRR